MLSIRYFRSKKKKCVILYMQSMHIQAVNCSVTRGCQVNATNKFYTRVTYTSFNNIMSWVGGIQRGRPTNITPATISESEPQTAKGLRHFIHKSTTNLCKSGRKWHFINLSDSITIAAGLFSTVMAQMSKKVVDNTPWLDGNNRDCGTVDMVC